MQSDPKRAEKIKRKLSVFDRFFDEDWYREVYPDVRDFKDGPKQHYLQFGHKEGRSPHPFFDIKGYQRQYPEVSASDIEPINYYIDQGWRKLHSPHPLFDPAWYLTENTDILSSDTDPLLHYLENGWSEGRQLHPLFDTKWYLDAYPDVAKLSRDPLSHFLTFGWKEGRRPHPLFDTEWYLDQYPDIAKADINPWLHYIQTGWLEGRSPSDLFHAEWYVETYLDPLEHSCEPLTHYLTEGWKEGLLPSPGAKDTATNARAEAPLYRQVVDELAKDSRWQSSDLSRDGSRGRLILVVHETDVGGAPHVLKQIALWLRNRTRFDVRIVALKGGNLRAAFAEVAPLLVLTDHPISRRTEVVKEWIGDNVKGVFLNSIASGKFVQHMPTELPMIAFIHELPQVLDLFPAEIDLVRDAAQRVISGGPDVNKALRTQYGFDADKLVSAFSFVEALPDDTDYAQRRADAREALGLPEDRIVVMGCGLLHWRKSPDKFVETAKILRDRGIDAEFVWLGGGRDQEACETLVVENDLEDRVRFTGYEPDVAGKLAGADIFLLSSQEDPFPLVALYAAQAGLPIVCFQDAGGIEGFVSAGSGVAVPFMDVSAMADAVADYVSNAQRRTQDGLIGRGQVERSHTIEAVGPMLLHHLRDVIDMPPEVSVIVPNYNYETYLPERLGSISAQTLQDFEVILLDDASPDASVLVLEDFAVQRAGTRVVVNAENSGSPFVQWMRGMDLAQSDLIWLAEADDRCTSGFLETLVPMFDDPNIRIASCASRPVTAEGESIGDYRPMYLDRITPGRWDRDYIATDHEEANAGLGIANSIPNASAVMFRKFQPEPEFVAELTSMRLCGDWYFYVRAMRGGLVGFSAKLMNDHRRHGNTVTHKLEGSLRYFNELATVRDYLGRHYVQSAPTQSRIAEFYAQDITRFGVTDTKALPKTQVQDKALPSLLMVTPDLSPGGGQVFAISIANEWARRGGRVVLLNVGNQPSHPAMLTKVAPEVMLLHASEPGTDLGTLITRFDIDVIHSSIWWADRWVDTQRDALPDDMPWIISMHGCHETFLQKPSMDRSFPERMNRMIGRATWVYTAEKNLAVFDTYDRPATLSRIPNGMTKEPIQTQYTRQDLGLRDDALVLCLASRAIDSKGWNEAVRLTKRLNDAGHVTDLMLIGEGPAADHIGAMAPDNVHLYGQVSNLQDYLRLADIGLLPSYFVGESLPLILLEMMAQSLPIVASEIGEIPWMLGAGETAAGLLIPLTKAGIDENALYDTIVQLTDPQLRNKIGVVSQEKFENNFTLEAMVDRYLETYSSNARHWNIQAL